MTRWKAVAPACALAATLAVGACGRDDDSNGNHWAGKPDKGERASADTRGDTTGLAGNADVQGEARGNDASGMAISLVGCVRRAAPGSGRYVLSDVQSAGMGDTPVGTSGQSGQEGDAAAAPADRYDLVTSTGQELGDHVGRRVKVTGRLATPTAQSSSGGNMSSPDAPTGTSGSGSPRTDSGINRTGSADTASRTLYVSSVQRFGGDTCSSGSGSPSR